MMPTILCFKFKILMQSCNFLRMRCKGPTAIRRIKNFIYFSNLVTALRQNKYQQQLKYVTSALFHDDMATPYVSVPELNPLNVMRQVRSWLCCKRNGLQRQDLTHGTPQKYSNTLSKLRSLFQVSDLPFPSPFDSGFHFAF